MIFVSGLTVVLSIYVVMLLFCFGMGWKAIKDFGFPNKTTIASIVAAILWTFVVFILVGEIVLV